MTSVKLDDFSPEEREIIARLNHDAIPRHIAVIMDGNGRWATQQNLPRVIGHQAGTETIRTMVNACSDLGVEYLTLYSFSTENWSRPDSEVHALMDLIEQSLRNEADHLHTKNVRIRHLGSTDGLPESLREALDYSQTLTAKNTKLTLQLAINYGSRTEILHAAIKLAGDAANGLVDIAKATEEDFARCLYAPDIPDPELLIRTAGEQRISNYLLWQIAYSELWFTPVLWPDLRAIHLLGALEDYQQRQRKFGGVVS